VNVSRSRVRLAGALAILLVAGCVSPPRPTTDAVRRSRNPTALVEGVVRDPAGRPVAGVSVHGLPREKDLLWSPASVTDADGRFRLVLDAPGEYGFLIYSGGVTVVTPRSDDPSRTTVSLRPADHRTGIALVFRREDRESAILSPR
jgi:hypothetical protein